MYHLLKNSDFCVLYGKKALMRLFFLTFLCLGFLISCSSDGREKFSLPTSNLESDENQHLAALSILSDAIKNNPSNPVNYYKRAMLHEKIENYADALVDINRAERLNPNSGLYLFEKAKIQSKLNKKEALENALTAENQNFDQPELDVLIAELYSRNKNFAKADEYLKKAHETYPYNYEIFLVKGKNLARQGDTLSAIMNLNKSLTYQKNNFETYDQLIKIYTGINKIDSALVLNEQVIKHFPKKKEMVYNKALILEKAGALDSARHIFEAFFKLEPNRNDVLGKIGMLYFKTKNYSGAQAIFNKWSNVEPENIEPLQKLAAVYEAQDNFNAAKENIEKAIKIEPNNKTLVYDLNRYNYKLDELARIYEAQNQYRLNRKYREENDQNANLKEKPEPERRIFGGSIGNIEKIQKRTTVIIGKDSTRN